MKIKNNFDKHAERIVMTTYLSIFFFFASIFLIVKVKIKYLYFENILYVYLYSFLLFLFLMIILEAIVPIITELLNSLNIK